MVERNEAGPPRALLDLVRRETASEASPRRHQASRARLLTSYEGGSRLPRWFPIAAMGTLLLGGASFEGVQYYGRHHVDVSAAKPVEPLDQPGPIGPAEPEEPAEPAEPAAVDTPAEEPAEEAAGIVIRAEPDTAEITWDGRPLEGNPAKVPELDGKPHEVMAKLAGYAPVRQTVIAKGASVIVSLELVPVPLALGPVTSTSPLSGADDLIAAMRPRVRECHVEGISNNGLLLGKATLVVETDGTSVTAASVADAEGLPANVTTCLAHVASDTHFDTRGKEASIRVPVRFGKP